MPNDGLDRNGEDHKRIDRSIARLHRDMKLQKQNVDKLLSALRDLIDRIPPENLKSE
jgi:hypothetical protein